MSSILNSMRFNQVAFVVHDLEEAKKKYALLFGVEVPPSYDVKNPLSNTEVYGKPSKAACRQAFFDLSDGVQLELIQPNEEPSAWRNFLNEKGEGLHHIAFRVDDMDAAIKACEEEGMVLMQQGLYEDLSGRYAYVDGGDNFKCIIELLQNFND